MNPPIDAGARDAGVSDAGVVDAGCDASYIDGGIAGVLAWLQESCGWQQTNMPDDRAIYREASAAQLARIPALEWVACGAGCESASVALGVNGTFAAFSTVQDGQIQHAYAAVTNPVPLTGGGYFTLRRVISLFDGATINALSARYAQHVVNTSVHLTESESAFKLFASESVDTFRGVDAAFEIATGRWDFKQPWYDSSVSSRYAWCASGGLSASPPSVMFFCSDQVEIMNQQGSRTPWIVPDSALPIAAGADNGLAVWVQPSDGGMQRSRVRTWTPGNTDVSELAEIDGSVCSVGPRADQIVGFRGQAAGGCAGFLSDKRFFRLVPDGGVIDGPFIGGDSLAVTRISVGRDYAAAYGIWQSMDAGQKREFVALIRLSDWKMKRFWAPTGSSLSSNGLIVDDDYLYFASVFDQGTQNGQIDRIYRFELKRFDEIGEAFE